MAFFGTTIYIILCALVSKRYLGTHWCIWAFRLLLGIMAGITSSFCKSQKTQRILVNFFRIESKTINSRHKLVFKSLWLYYQNIFIWIQDALFPWLHTYSYMVTYDHWPLTRHLFTILVAFIFTSSGYQFYYSVFLFMSAPLNATLLLYRRINHCLIDRYIWRHVESRWLFTIVMIRVLQWFRVL